MANHDSKQKKNDVMGMDPSQERAQDAQTNPQTQNKEVSGIAIEDSERLEQDRNRQAQGRDRNQNAQASDRKDSKEKVQEFPHHSVADNAGNEFGKETTGQRNTGQRNEGTGGYGGSKDLGRAGRQQSEERSSSKSENRGNETDESKRKKDVA